MKKLLFILTMVTVFLSVNCFADQTHKFYIRDIQLSPMTVGSGLESEYIIDFDGMRPQGFASLQVEISGSGTLNIYHESSNDGITYNPSIVNGVSTGSDIVAALTTGSAFYVFDVPICRYLKVNFLETTGTATVTLTKATLLIQ